MEICVPWFALPDFHKNEPFVDTDKASQLQNAYLPVIYMI